MIVGGNQGASDGCFPIPLWSSSAPVSPRWGISFDVGYPTYNTVFLLIGILVLQAFLKWRYSIFCSYADHVLGPGSGSPSRGQSLVQTDDRSSCLRLGLMVGGGVANYVVLVRRKFSCRLKPARASGSAEGGERLRRRFNYLHRARVEDLHLQGSRATHTGLTFSTMVFRLTVMNLWNLYF
jgi:hypothetical protein